ncbi:helicase-related protein [Methanolacinia paynteri]|uniref:helicase-related protein n=1 Tax=Methanolacinia paynteri TaxID=230356 RepID=UPI00065001EF|nr:helicase-related protein [Methanolacinia paynteri]
MTVTERKKIIERLSEDLVGPYKEDEKLESRPSDVYISGILWPKDTRIGPEEDDQLGLASAGFDNEESAGTGEEEEIAVSSINRPSSAGLSFAVASNKEIPKIAAKVFFATYSYQNVQTDEEEDNSDGNKAEKRKKSKIEWIRHQHKIDILHIEVPDGGNNIIEIEDPDLLPRIQLHIRSVHWKEKHWLVTATLINKSEPPQGTGRNDRELFSLFQVRLEIRPESGTSLVARPSRRAVTGNSDDDEDLSTALLYRNALEYATGHTSSAEWESGSDPGTASMVATTWIPHAFLPSFSSEGHNIFSSLRSSETPGPLSAEWLSDASDAELGQALDEIPNAYARWIALQEEKINILSPPFGEQAKRNIARCRQSLQRMHQGAELIGSNPAVAEAFRLANRAMELQYQWNTENPGEILTWRPFQMGFILLAVSSVADRSHPDRNVMDLLWFPTGGGKTEAYLGLIAFLAFYRRLSSPSNPDEGAGVAALMRYTLRLLTTQQFIRASSMILACDAIRRGQAGKVSGTDKLGDTPFSIGLWVGGEATPNKFRIARDSLEGTPGLATPKQLKICPACKSALKWTFDDSTEKIEVRCPDTECILHNGGNPLPVYTVDDDIYRSQPTLLIGTIDKFAQILRRKEVSHLFSLKEGRKPDLIIQDELHLISGPLGTLAGLYETAIDQLFTQNGIRPKIIGSTATIRRARDQVNALFNRETCQFPPAAIDADDSGFAIVDKDAPGRVYLGVTTAGRSAKYSLQAVSASLLQSVEGGLEDPYRDYYWTLVSYFNSLRELGGAVVLMRDDVNDTISMIAARRHERQREPEDQEELTSMRTQEEVREMLELLERKADSGEAIDVVLATNMLSVGVDIKRLGLMLVNGQPKGISEYIQATSRVGRGTVPGLIVALLNNAKARDRSHYESFGTWHNTLYRDVEATSVTPFASRARDRALHAVLVALLRYNAPGMLDQPIISEDDLRTADDMISYITERARKVDPEESAIGYELQDYLDTWQIRQPRAYWDSRKPSQSLLQDAEKAATLKALGYHIGNAWPTMNNMRSVEPSTPFRLKEKLKDFSRDGD